MTIYTGRGDEGETSLADGTRIPKTSERVEAYGTVDEAEGAIALARAVARDESLCSLLDFMQQRFMNCASNLATPFEHHTETTPAVAEADVRTLEAHIDRYMEFAGPIDHFIVPAGDELTARLHFARSVTRRAERRVTALAGVARVDPLVMCFLNRSSDALYAAARYSAAQQGDRDELWDPGAPLPSD